MARRITLVYFAWVREKIGADQETITLPDDVRTIAELLAHLATLSAQHAAALADTSLLRFARNHDFAPITAVIGDGDEVAIFPPVTGGVRHV